jgi:hypothetical protein
MTVDPSAFTSRKETRMNRLALVLVSATLAACTAPSNDPSNHTGNPTLSTSVPPTGTHLVLPSLGGGMPQLQSGSITLTGDTGPGNATFTNAALWQDAGAGPPSFGTGSFSVTLASTTYASSDGQSMFATLPDNAGNSYLVIGVMAPDASGSRVQVVYAVVKQSDFAAGADVALDGVDRYALYVGGPYDSENPDTLAVASSGTLHFDSAATLTGPLTASLSATFAAADPSALVPDAPDGGEPRGPDGGGPPPPPPGGPLTPPSGGVYTLRFGAVAQAHCTGTLSGKEADFSALAPASFGFVDQTVTISVSTGNVSMSGAGLTAAFGANPLPLTTDASTPFWQYTAPLSGGAGPDATTLGYALFGLDASTPTPYGGQAAVVYFAADRSSYCGVGFDVTLTP